MRLEDDFTWVLAKALRGHGLTLREAAKRAGLAPAEAEAFAGGGFGVTAARRLAEVLELAPEALVAHPDYLPPPVAVPGLTRLALPFEGDTVNAWLIRHHGVTWLFDTGAGATDCRDALADLGVEAVDAVWLTHAHPDHIGGLGHLAFTVARGPGLAGAEACRPGDRFQAGGLTVTAHDLAGHAAPALGWLVAGLELPLLVCGDAVFAGSIGGCRDAVAYRLALRTLRETTAPLPDATVLLPGHGPATTLGAERRHNPFLAGPAFGRA